jgi:DNA mismatch repair protein MutL
VVCSPDHSEATARAVYLFVNGRWVRDRSAAHAVLRAFAGTLPAGRHPAGILFVGLPLGRVDVNVHPQKHEVRFAEPREVQDALFHAVASALRTAPWLGRSRVPGAPGSSAVSGPSDGAPEGVATSPLAA